MARRYTTRELVARAEKKGIKITFKERKDGGIRVTAINGVKYKDSKGNTQLRKLMKAPLSRRRKRQLQAVRPRLPANIQSLVRRIKKGRFGRPGKKTNVGNKIKVGFREVRKALKREGLSQVEAYLKDVLWRQQELISPVRLDNIIALTKSDIRVFIDKGVPEDYFAALLAKLDRIRRVGLLNDWSSNNDMWYNFHELSMKYRRGDPLDEVSTAADLVIDEFTAWEPKKK